MIENFETIEQAENYLKELENKVSNAKDRNGLLLGDLEKTKLEIESIKNLQTEIRKSNYSFYEQLGRQVESKPPVEEKEVTIKDIIDNF